MHAFLCILAILIFVGIFIFLEWYNSPQQIGKRGEEFVHDILTNLSEEYYILDDIVLETQRGTTQIDHIVVSKYGIFVIETKNYSGDIYGDDYRQQWTQIIVTDVVYERNIFKEYTYVTKSHFYNPVKQSLSHCNVIRKSILHGWDIPVVPIVVFVGKADLRNVDTNHHVVYEYDLLSTIQSYQTEYLSSSDIQKFLTKLTEKNVREFVDNKTHVRNIEATITEKNEKIQSGICPMCGGTLVLRNGRYGNFYGCSNYPRCHFTTN